MTKSFTPIQPMTVEEAKALLPRVTVGGPLKRALELAVASYTTGYHLGEHDADTRWEAALKAQVEAWAKAKRLMRWNYAIFAGAGLLVGVLAAAVFWL